MKTTVGIMAAGVVVGLAAAYLALGTLFSFPFTIVPICLAAAGSFLLARRKPERWLLLALCVALPTVIPSAVILHMLRLENKMDWGWVVVMAVAVGVCVVPSWLATVIQPRERKEAGCCN